MPTLYGFVVEGTAAGTSITLYAPNGTIMPSIAFDPDYLQNGMVTYAVSGDDRFEYNADISELVLVSDSLDREESSRILFSLTATDGAADGKHNNVLERLAPQNSKHMLYVSFLRSKW